MGEFKPEQIRGNASDYTNSDWRYSFYLSSFPDGVRESVVSDMPDSQALELSKKSWDQFFNPQYYMASYNVSSDLLSIFSGETDLSQLGSDGSAGSFGGSGTDTLTGVEPLKNKEGNTVENPIVFTDSFLLPTGFQIWIPMNSSSTGLPNYQAFTIGGALDSERAGGFPLGAGLNFGSGDTDFSALIGNVYLPEYWANQTDFLGEANGQTLTSRGKEQYDSYLIKTGLSIDDPQLETIAQKIAEFTNTNDRISPSAKDNLRCKFHFDIF
jgi:hypothetical protein